MFKIADLREVVEFLEAQKIAFFSIKRVEGGLTIFIDLGTIGISEKNDPIQLTRTIQTKLADFKLEGVI